MDFRQDHDKTEKSRIFFNKNAKSFASAPPGSWSLGEETTDQPAKPEIGKGSRDQCCKGERHASNPKPEILRLPADADGMNKASPEQQQPHDVEDDRGSALQFRERHQDNGQRRIFGEVAMGAEAAKQELIAAITEWHLGLASCADDPKAEQDEQEGRQ
jgi:hypothetical protein